LLGTTEQSNIKTIDNINIKIKRETKNKAWEDKKKKRLELD